MANMTRHDEDHLGEMLARTSVPEELPGMTTRVCRELCPRGFACAYRTPNYEGHACDLRSCCRPRRTLRTVSDGGPLDDATAIARYERGY